MTVMRVLLVEDDEPLGTQVATSLRAAGYLVDWVTCGDDALAADFASFSLVILDLMLPGAHGFDVLKALRNDAHHVPVLVLSARHDAADKVRGLELGADDYLTKPFWPEELLARVRARLRRPALAPAGASSKPGRCASTSTAASSLWTAPQWISPASSSTWWRPWPDGPVLQCRGDGWQSTCSIRRATAASGPWTSTSRACAASSASPGHCDDRVGRRLPFRRRPRPVRNDAAHAPVPDQWTGRRAPCRWVVPAR